ncbi:putative reverse transcriptase domain-containing protein [Tanacetum coccineum]
MKQNGVSQYSISLNLFPFSLTHEAESWFYHLKTHSIHTWEEMILKFLSKYYPHSRALQLRKDILNFRQLPMESVFEAWERFKSCLRICPDHRISLIDQIFTFYHGIMMVDRDKIMVDAGGNIMRKTPQEAYDLIENMTQHHFQWDAEVYYDTTTGVSAHYSETTYASIAPVEDEPSELLEVQRSIHPLSGSPTPSSDLIVESFSLLLTPFGDSDSLVEETDTLLSHFNDSSPDYETFCFNIEEKSSGSTTTHSDYSLPDYEAFYFDDDHIEEKSSGSTTTHSDFSLLEYDSFIFDLSIDPLPPANRSDFYHEEFADELAHIISPPKYDYFYFDLETDPGEFTSVVEKNIFDLSSTKESTSIELNDFPLILSDCDSSLSKEFSEIDLLVLFPPRNKDKVFDPGIFTINRVHSKRFSILLLDDFSSILFVRDFLFVTDPSEIETFLSFPSGNEDKVFDPGILLNNGIFSFTRKSPHLLIDNFMIDNCHILSKISLKIVSFISFHPKDKEIRGETPYDIEDLRACFQSSNHAVSDHLHDPEMSLSMTQILILIMILPTSSTNLHNTNTRHTRVSFVEGTLTRVLIVKQGTHPSLIRVPVTIKTLVLTNLHSILRVSHNSSTVVSSVEVHIIVMIAKQGTCLSMIRVLVTIKTLVMTNLHFILRINNSSSTVVRSVEVPIIALIVKPGTNLSMSLILFTPPQPLPLSELKRREFITYMIESQELFDKTQEQIMINQEKLNMEFQNALNRLQEMMNLRNSNQDPPIDLYDLKRSKKGDNKIDSLTMEPSNTFLIGDEVTLVYDDLECDLPITTHFPTTDVREEKVDMDLPFGEHLDTLSTRDREIDFNPSRDIEELERLLADDPFPKVFDEPLGHSDSISRSYDVTFSNPLFDFNGEFTLCNDNPLFDEEFEDISSLDHPKSAPLNYEPLGNPDSVSRSLETSDLILEELTAEIGLDNSIPTEIDDGYYDSEGDILFLEHLLIEETFSDPTPAVLPKKSTLLVTPLPDPKKICLTEVERFDPFFSLTQSGNMTRVMESPSLGFHHMPSPRPATYSPKEVMYRFYHPHLTSGDGFDHGPKMK